MNSEERSKRTSKINTWKPTNQKQIFVEQDGKIFVCWFDRIFQQKELAKYNKFYIKKGSYENQLDIITKYINFFINNYDTDNELVNAYLKIKFETDDKHTFTEENMDAYISFLYEIIFTDTLIEKINQLVEDNYLDDIESDSEEKRKKYMKNEKKHLESLEFTNQHIKILLRISLAMKIMCPALFHYHAINTIKIEKDSDNIFRFYKPLFDIFGKVKKSTDTAYVTSDGFYYVYNEATQYYDKYDDYDNSLISVNISQEIIDSMTDLTVEPRIYFAEYNLYNKLYVYVKAKVNESYSNNSPIFDQQEIFGVDLYSVIQSFVRRVLISENIVKYKFNNIWDSKQKKYKENIIGFNKTIIKYQLIYFLKEQYSKNLTEVTNAKNSDGLSGVDKLLMNLSKIDESITIMADINIPLTIDYLKKRFEVSITEDEIDYYVKNHHPDNIQILLVRSFFAKYFGSYRDLNLLRRRDYITLVILLKKKLMNELGYDNEPTEEGETRPVALPYIISGNCTDRINTRVIRNIQFTQKVEDSYTFQHLQEDNHKYLNFIKPDFDMSLLSSLVNTKYTYVEYDNQSLTGQEITYSDDKIADEALFFLTSI